MTHIGVSKTELKSCVNWFASFTYSSAIEHAKQLVIFAIVLTVVIVSGTAKADIYKPSDFFDFDYAKKIWTSFDQAAFDAEWKRVSPAWEAWVKANGPKIYKENLAELNKAPNAAQIKHGHDLHMVWGIWTNIYMSFVGGNSINFGANAWNQNRGFACNNFQGDNVFTRKCNDIPDWRTTKERARDERVLAEYHAREEARRNR
tara:strand:- start:977 stop:1585 length:609 start_codon:yes stop_codon:yes gene_type:complete